MWFFWWTVNVFLEHSVCKSCRGPRLFGFLCWVLPQSVHFASPAVKQHIRERILPPKCGSSWQNVNIFRALSPYQWAHTVCVCVCVSVCIYFRGRTSSAWSKRSAVTCLLIIALFILLSQYSLLQRTCYQRAGDTNLFQTESCCVGTESQPGQPVCCALLK